MTRSARWIERLWGRLAGRHKTSTAGESGELRRLAGLPVGARGTVRGLAAAETRYAARLVALGVTPGASLEVLQRFPTLVVRCDQTELALEPALARLVLVEPETPATASESEEADPGSPGGGLGSLGRRNSDTAARKISRRPRSAAE